MALTRRTWAALLLVGALPIAIRLTLLPMVAHSPPGGPGRVLLPLPGGDVRGWPGGKSGHPLWQFFEAPHLVVHPLVYSKYPPA
jgi:hypothetical protein